MQKNEGPGNSEKEEWSIEDEEFEKGAMKSDDWEGWKND